MRPDDERYFAQIEDRLDEAWDVAEAAKEQGHDPKPKIEIPIARDMADRVENILGIDGVAERVRELEGEMSREEAALELVTDFVEGTVGDYDSGPARSKARSGPRSRCSPRGSSPRRSRGSTGSSCWKTTTAPNSSTSTTPVRSGLRAGPRRRCPCSSPTTPDRCSTSTSTSRET